MRGKLLQIKHIITDEYIFHFMKYLVHDFTCPNNIILCLHFVSLCANNSSRRFVCSAAYYPSLTGMGMEGHHTFLFPETNARVEIIVWRLFYYFFDTYTEN